MMHLQLFKPLWGHSSSFEVAVKDAVDPGFDGIEGAAPESVTDSQAWHAALSEHDLRYVAEICTGGTYVPNREATLRQHLDDFDRKLELSLRLDPLFVNCLGGLDAWPEEQSFDFFAQAIEIAERAEVLVSFETHRGRSFFNPWVTDRLTTELPHIKLTCDYSHWCVVCERLIDTELDVLQRLANHAHHIHARVGYDQGPQVPHPGAPEYEPALRAHQRWWEMIWHAQSENGYTVTTMTPEFGPDGYLHHAPFTQEPVANLWTLNCWIADEERSHFNSWLGRRKK